MIPCFLSNARIKSPILLQYPAHVKADLDGTIFTYDYRARLAYAMTFDPIHTRTIFSYDVHMGRAIVMGLIYTTLSVAKS